MLRFRGGLTGTARGASLVESMVGIAVGLIVVAGALTLFVTNLSGSRRLAKEVRLSQDLRAAAEVVARDLRRAGYWANAIQGTTTGTGSTTTQNPYSGMTVATDTVGYAYSRDATENNTLDASEQFGFRLSAGALQMQTASGTWTDLTDPFVETITTFTLTPVLTTLPLGNLCPTVCAAGAPNCPTITVRKIAITLSGQSTSDSAVTRSHSAVVRVRNDQLAGICPA